MSTSQTDFILVHEKNLRTAITALKDTFHVIDCVPLLPILLLSFPFLSSSTFHQELSPEEMEFSGELNNEIVPQLVASSGSEPRMFVFRPNLEVTLHDQELCICSYTFLLLLLLLFHSRTLRSVKGNQSQLTEFCILRYIESIKRGLEERHGSCRSRSRMPSSFSI